MYVYIGIRVCDCGKIHVNIRSNILILSRQIMIPSVTNTEVCPSTAWLFENISKQLCSVLN